MGRCGSTRLWVVDARELCSSEYAMSLCCGGIVPRCRPNAPYYKLAV